VSVYMVLVQRGASSAASAADAPVLC